MRHWERRTGRVRNFGADRWRAPATARHVNNGGGAGALRRRRRPCSVQPSSPSRGNPAGGGKEAAGSVGGGATPTALTSASMNILTGAPDVSNSNGHQQKCYNNN